MEINEKFPPSGKTLKIIIAVLAFAAFLYLIGNRNFRAVLYLGEEITKLKSEVSHLKNENVRLEGELRRIKEDPSYFEELARKKLGMIKPGETKYKVIDPESPVKSGRGSGVDKLP